jgi:ribosomal protein S18 acetylase RimI-like enzyme
MQPEIFWDFSSPSIKHAVKNNLYEFFRSFGQSPYVDRSEDGGLLRWHTAVQHPWFNGVLSTGVPTADTAESIQATLAYFRSKDVDAISWWLEPGVKINAWADILSQHGFLYDDHTPGMAVEISRLTDHFKLPASFTLRQVQDRAELRTWAETFTTGYGLPSSITIPFYNLLTSLGLDLPNRHYLGYMGNTPVATASLFMASGVAGIYNVATLMEARGMGIGGIMTAHPLRQASTLGYKVGVLQSSEMGYTLYRRLGFEKQCAMEHYYQYLR